MKISYIQGACVKHDAISNSIRDEITVLRANGIEDVRLYAHECQYEAVPFSRAGSFTDIVLDPHFQSSDLAVFHFGIYYPFFDLLPIVPRRAKRLVVFHNITPKEFVSAEHHAVIDKSFAQMWNIAWADHVICDSETNLAVLRSFGIGVPASVLPLAVQVDAAPPPLKPSFGDGIARIVFVGRFVRAKGPQDLLAALQRSVDAGLRLPLRLDMVGNLVFSDPKLVRELRQIAQRLERSCGAQLQIQIHGNATDQTKHELLREADVFVLPTYHEGFCVPIVEALASGCKVIAYDNSNTPAISGGLATLIPTGDVDELARAIKNAFEQVSSSEWQHSDVGNYAQYAALAHSYVQQLSGDRTRAHFVGFVRELADTASRRIVHIRLPGIPEFRFEVHTRRDQYISAEIVQNNNWEPFETSVFRSLCREGDFVLDIGANIGWYAVIGSFSVGRIGRVMCFEPDTDNYEILERNLQRCAATNVQALRIALGAVSTDANLYLSETNCGDHHLFDDGTARITVPIRTDTLDQIFVDRVRLPDIVKSDTQGSEGLILRGAGQLLAKGWRPAWLLEFWPFGLCKSGTDPLELVKTLRDLGYQFFEIIEQNLKLVKTDHEMLAARVNTDLYPDGARFINLLAVPQNSDRIEKLKESFGYCQS
jgi:FkbM family methyltransferase